MPQIFASIFITLLLACSSCVPDSSGGPHLRSYITGPYVVGDVTFISECAAYDPVLGDEHGDVYRVYQVDVVTVRTSTEERYQVPSSFFAIGAYNNDEPVFEESEYGISLYSSRNVAAGSVPDSDLESLVSQCGVDFDTYSYVINSGPIHAELIKNGDEYCAFPSGVSCWDSSTVDDFLSTESEEGDYNENIF